MHACIYTHSREVEGGASNHGLYWSPVYASMSLKKDCSVKIEKEMRVNTFPCPNSALKFKLYFMLSYAYHMFWGNPKRVHYIELVSLGYEAKQIDRVIQIDDIVIM